PDAGTSSPWGQHGRRWSIPTCPFNESHTGGSAFIGITGDDEIVAKCQHNSCKWRWADLMAKLDPDGSDEWKDEDRQRPKQAAQIVGLALELLRIGQNSKNEPFAVLHEGPHVAQRLGGSGGCVRDILAREFRRRNNAVMGSAAFNDALSVLRGEALDTEPEECYVRVGPYNGGIVLDLGTADGRAVIVDSSGWRVVDRSPILFQRTALMRGLAIPEAGGDLSELRSLLNVTDETWPVLLGWMIAALIPDIPHPILMLGGQQGTGKTTAARFICGLFDPSSAPTRSQPRDAEAWAMSVANSWTAVIDNVSSIAEWWSDALCKAVTGDGWIRRTLYTDGDVSVLNFRRVIVLTSIDAGALRGDLGERLVLVDLEPIPASNRRTEQELDALFKKMGPRVLGALLETLSKVLSRLASVKLTQLPRMADFARILAAMDAEIGTDALQRYSEQGKRIASDVIEADPVGEAVLRFMHDKANGWTGSMTELLKQIQPSDPPRSWPRSARALSANIKRLAPALRAQGVEICVPKPNDRTRQYHLHRIAQTAQQPQTPVSNSNKTIVSGVRTNPPSQPPNDRPSPNLPTDDNGSISGRLGDSGGLGHGSTYEDNSDDLEGWLPV
ncbi:MAG: hypothetical protein ACK54H_09050, partial [Phycisphaerales bacterium]